jgi:hypothetical protein
VSTACEIFFENGLDKLKSDLIIGCSGWKVSRVTQACQQFVIFFEKRLDTSKTDLIIVPYKVGQRRWSGMSNVNCQCFVENRLEYLLREGDININVVRSSYKNSRVILSMSTVCKKI